MNKITCLYLSLAPDIWSSVLIMGVTVRHGWFRKRPAVEAVSSVCQSGCAFTQLEQPQLVFSSKLAAPEAMQPLPRATITTPNSS